MSLFTDGMLLFSIISNTKVKLAFTFVMRNFGHRGETCFKHVLPRVFCFSNVHSTFQKKLILFQKSGQIDFSTTPKEK